MNFSSSHSSLNFVSLDDIKQMPYKPPSFSLCCIYCSSRETRELIRDGSFRQCLNTSCRRQFQAKIVPPPAQVNYENTNTFLRQKHPNEFIMFNQQHLLQQQREEQGCRLPAPANLKR